jgi:hypothetical protein
MALFHFRLPLDNIGPNREAHNERIKLIAVSLNAAGLAALFGGVLGPLFDAARPFHGPQAAFGFVTWLAFFLAAYKVMGYIKAKD